MTSRTPAAEEPAILPGRLADAPQVGEKRCGTLSEMRPLVVSYGGGVNSLAMLIWYRQQGIRPDAIVFADTRGEKPETYAYMRNVLPSWLKCHGFPPLTVTCRAEWASTRRLRTGDQSLLDECLRLGYMPSRAYGYSTCADKWKLDPFMWWSRREYPTAAVIMRAVGFDAEEAHRVDETVDAGFGKTYPLIDAGWDRDECERQIRAVWLPLPPKSACYYCPSSKKHEVLALAQTHPMLFKRAIYMESRALGNGKSRIDGLGRHWSWKALVEADEAARAELSDSVEGCTTCTLAS